MTQLYTIDQFRLNYEQQKQYKICIQFINESQLIEETFLINIEDINESPYNLQCSNQTGFCTASDDDFNQTLQFQIKNTKIFENETFWEVICTDNGQPPLSVSTWIKVLPDNLTLIFVPVLSVIIPVNDENNNNTKKQTRDNIVILYSNDGDKTERQRRQANSPPQDISFNMFYLTVPENSRDFEIGSIYVTDADNDNYTCTVNAYDVSPDRQPFEIINGSLRTSLTMHNNNYDLDYETEPTYGITITCTDLIHHFSINKNFTVNIDDVNEAPVQLALIPDILPENSPAGYVIGQLFTVDPDLASNNQTFEYSIIMNHNQMYKIENDQLILTRENDVEMCINQPDLCPHDFEQITSSLIRIRVEDNGQPRASQKFWIHITITDENDPPVHLQLDDNVVKENSPIETLIGSFSVQDQDLYQTHTYTIINQSPLLRNQEIFKIEDYYLRLVQSPDYEQDQFYLITIRATDNGTIPKSITTDFLIEIVDIDELPDVYVFISNTDSIIPNDTIDHLINGRQPVRTIYLPQSAYFLPIIGRIVFLMNDHDRVINLNNLNNSNSNELDFSKPTCEILTKDPFHLICTSIVTIANPHTFNDNDGVTEHLIVTSLVLSSNDKTTTFPKPLRLKFENITLTINDKPIESIDIPKMNSSGLEIGSLHAIDLANGGQPVENVILNPNNSLSYPLELVNSSILKVRDDVNFSISDLPSTFNVSVFVTTAGEDSRTTEKFIVVNIKNKNDFILSLTNNKTMENSHENTTIGKFVLENGIGNYTIDLIDNANGRFKLNETTLLTTQKYVEHCHFLRTCPLDHESESSINIEIAVRDPSTSKTLRHMIFPIEIEDENEPPYNITLSVHSIPENAKVGSTVSIINATDDDFNQTLTYTTDNAIFHIVDNQLILTTPLNHDQRQTLPIYIRATDNGQPPTSTEKLFIINVTPVNRAPLSVTPTSMTLYIPNNSENTSPIPSIVGQLHVIDPDENENFTITFDKPNFQALIPAANTFSIILDNGSVVYGQIYNISIVDLYPPHGQDNIDYFVNVTANVTDSSNHSISSEFFVHYLSKPSNKSTIISTTLPTTTAVVSLSQALHIRIYETTPPNTPVVRGLLSSTTSNSTLSNSSTCTAMDEQNHRFPIETNRSTFIISLPNNYTLNSTIHPTIIVNVQCNMASDAHVTQDIVIDVLPAPPTVQIKFNQTKPFYVTNNINNDTILGRFYPIELTTTPTNRTYNLSLINNQEIFRLLPNNSLYQIGPYPSGLLVSNQPYVNLTIQLIETTPSEPTRIIQTTFNIPIIVNSTVPFITFSRTSIPNDTNPNGTIGNFTVHNITTPYRLHLIDSYNNSLELDPYTNIITLKQPLHTLPLINNQTQLSITVALLNQTNGTILSSTFPLTITYRSQTYSCLNKDCGNGTCINLNETSSYCLCTSGYTGIDCQIIDSCAFNPCTNNGICHQLSIRGDFSCQCLPNYSGSRCEILIDICQLNTSICSSTDLCITIYNNLTNLFRCIPREELLYLVFDYLNNYKTIDVVNDENLLKKIEDFIKKNISPIENIIVPERKILGPYKYNRAELISVAVQIPNENITTLNNALKSFCINQSLIIDSFGREICSGYQQAIYLDQHFKSSPDFCPNCTFSDAVDKYYWFDKTLPFLPLWITLIVGSLLMTAIPLIPFPSKAPKKVALPLMKAKVYPENEHETIDEGMTLLTKSVRSAAKFSCHSYRERHDSGYESNEDSENYLEQIITNYQQQESFHVYPILHTPRSPPMERRDLTIDDIFSSNSTHRSRSRSSPTNRRRSIQRSVSMSTQRYPRQSTTSHNQTLKPIIQRRSTLFESSIGTLIGLIGTPRLNHDDETYVSTRFRNENTSKFVIGTLWNTFALVNNLFLQRPRKRRNALSGDANIQADQLARLQALYSLAEREQANDFSTDNLRGIITEILSKPETNRTKHLQSIIYDILSSTKRDPCHCYGDHHIPSCIYYDHSIPYLRRSNENISNLQEMFDRIRKSNKPRHQDATTQSYIEKPLRTFIHMKTTSNATTQSNSIPILTQVQYHVSTQYSPIENKNHISTQIDNQTYEHVNVSTQTIEKNHFTNVSTQFSPNEIDKNDNLQFLNRIKPKINRYDDHIYVNVSTQFSPEEIKDTKPTFTELNPAVIEENNIHDQRNVVMNELKEVLSSSSSIPKEQITNDNKPDKKPPPNHSVRSLVSLFETTTTATKDSNVIFPSKPTGKLPINDSKILILPNSNVLNIDSEEIHSSIVHETIEQYANEIASDIVDNAVLTATTTTVYCNEQQQQQRRFSFYNNGGGHGKSLLFQANTFVPLTGTVKQESDQNLRADSQASSGIINDPIISILPQESQHTLIVGRYINGEDSNQSQTIIQRHLTHDMKYDSSSLSSCDDEHIDQRQFLSNSQLFSAQELYIRPWLVRRATAPDIHCLDNDISDTHVETMTTSSIHTFFNVFPTNPNLDLYTRYTCLITILFYLRDIHDEYSNEILYNEVEQIEQQLINSTLTSPIIHSNVFQTINSDGSKRYRTGVILNINSSDSSIKFKIFAKQIEWKHVKVITRRFRKKYQHYKQLIKNDTKIKSNQLNIENYLKYFDSTSKRRMKKYAKHYAEKI